MNTVQRLDNEKSLTEQELLNAAEDDYMNDAQLRYFRDLLLKTRSEAEEHIKTLREDLVSTEREFDEVDIAADEETRRMNLRIIDREVKLLSKIDAALKRIQDGAYGYCEVTGKPIGIPRLLARPTASLSTEAKMDQEYVERIYRERDED